MTRLGRTSSNACQPSRHVCQTDDVISGAGAGHQRPSKHPFGLAQGEPGEQRSIIDRDRERRVGELGQGLDLVGDPLDEHLGVGGSSEGVEAESLQRPNAET